MLLSALNLMPLIISKHFLGISMWRVSVFSINYEAASHLVWIPGCYFLPTTGPLWATATEMRTAISKLGQWCGLYSTWVESVFLWGLKVIKMAKSWHAGTEWQLWGSAGPNTKHPGLSWHCALFPGDSSVTVFILIFLLQGPDFTKSTILTFIDR